MGCGPSAIPEDLSDAVIDISQVMVMVTVVDRVIRKMPELYLDFNIFK